MYPEEVPAIVSQVYCLNVHNKCPDITVVQAGIWHCGGKTQYLLHYCAFALLSNIYVRLSSIM